MYRRVNNKKVTSHKKKSESTELTPRLAHQTSSYIIGICEGEWDAFKK